MGHLVRQTLQACSKAICGPLVWIPLLWGASSWSQILDPSTIPSPMPPLTLAPSPLPSAIIPKTLTGYALDDIVSCANVDKLPWRFKKAGKKTRLLIKDNLKINTESRMTSWEIYQVMDAEGFVTFIFRRPLGSGQWESIVTKDGTYNRFVGNLKGDRRVTEKQDLKTLIDRPAIVFENSKGSSLSLIPGASGNTALSIQLIKAEGRLLPPVFIKGSVCTRPDDEKNDGATDDKTGLTPTAPKK